MRKIISVLAAVLASAGIAYAASLPYYTGSTIPTDMLGALNNLIGQINGGVNRNTMASYGQPRNFLLNGDMAVAQQGTAAIVGGTTSITALQFSADRWFVDTNVTSGVGKSQVITASPSPPPGFTNSISVWRDSGALTQPVCMTQEIETSRSTELQGKTVILSLYLQPLAGITSASGNVTAYIITGTGTDEGIASLTASTALTPAWTGIATAGSSTFALGTTAAWNRYNTGAVTIPAAATEVGVQVCFKPVGSASGATDGFALTGVQLEEAPANATIVAGLTGALTGPSAFEFRPYDAELRDCERFFYQLNEPASGAAVAGFGQATGSSATSWTIFLPQTMRGTTPVVVIPATGTFKTNIAGTPTTWVTPTAGVCSVTSCTITGGNTNTAGQAETLTGGGGTGKVYVKNDVVF